VLLSVASLESFSMGVVGLATLSCVSTVLKVVSERSYLVVFWRDAGNRPCAEVPTQWTYEQRVSGRRSIPSLERL
jgi:hypothetical protein